jgi:hypothetical protein
MSRIATLAVVFPATSKHPDGRVRTYPLAAATQQAAAEELAKHAANYVRTPVSVSITLPDDTLVMRAAWGPKLAWTSPKGKTAKQPVTKPVAAIACTPTVHEAKPARKLGEALETLANGQVVRIPLTYHGTLLSKAQAKAYKATYLAGRKSGRNVPSACTQAAKAAMAK